MSKLTVLRQLSFPPYTWSSDGQSYTRLFQTAISAGVQIYGAEILKFDYRLVAPAFPKWNGFWDRPL
jgi:hypothetical protein